MTGAYDGDWPTFSALLDEALDLAEPERALWLDELRRRDPAIADRLAATLREGGEEFDRFLQAPSVAPAESPGATLIGRQVGPYVIDAEIGHGGMGSVWRARRTDGRYEGHVAIKMVHASLIGGAGELRFQQEGQVLSRLSHPHIARLLDAGVIDGTQPYLILEYIEGEPLDSYCEQRSLGLKARIKLFLDVLDAVAHAHANLVVHRDLKPGNVLVTADGTVKLLDFGIAKLIDDAQSGLQTQLDAVAMTPLYAAPEQLLGQPVTTATDVYALGLMLFVLLTGKHPTAKESTARADVLRATLFTEAPRASRVAGLSAILARSLAGDLDNVLHKAIEKSAAARYSGAAMFAEDLRRYLADEPVLARPDTPGYRARKFVARHRLGTTLAGLAVTMLVASAIVSTMQSARASRAAAAAEIDRARADQAAVQARQQRDFALETLSEAQDLSELTTFLLGEALPDGDPKLREQVLMRGVRMVRASNAMSPSRRTLMLETLALKFENDRDFARAAELYAEAHAFALQGKDPTAIATSACHVAEMQAAVGPAEPALAATDEALANLPRDSLYADPRVLCHLMRSQILIFHGQSPQADLEAASRSLSDLMVPNPWLAANVTSQMARMYSNAMRVPETLDAYAAEERLYEQTGVLHMRDGAVHFSNLGVFYWKIGRPLDARANLERSLEIELERSSQNTEDAVSLLLRARIQAQLGDLGAALAEYEIALKKARASGDTAIDSIGGGEQVKLWVQAGQFARAHRGLPQAEARIRSHYAPNHWMLGVLKMQAALLAEHRREVDQAQRLADEAIQLLENGPGRENYQYPAALVQQSGLALRQGKIEAARAAAEKAMALYAARFGSVRSANIGDALVARGSAHLEAGNAEAAHADFHEAALHYESSLGPDHPTTLALSRK